VWVFDAHGHGLSEPKEEVDRFAITNFDHLVEDTERFLSDVVVPWLATQGSCLPLFLGGTSLGGLVV
jgi:alpha-beta hydrolase superfamily lysophospholipase